MKDFRYLLSKKYVHYKNVGVREIINKIGAGKSIQGGTTLH